MPGDSRECRRHAMKCLQLAADARSDSNKEHFLRIAATWQALANELEKAQAMLEAEEDIPNTGC